MREVNLTVDRDDHKLTPKEAAALLASSLDAPPADVQPIPISLVLPIAS